jgi:hypothetical protein
MNHDTTTRRFAYLETQLLWGNGLTAQELGAAFGIARQNAQAVLRAYRLLYPGNLRYDPQLKRQVISEHFVPRHINEDPYRFLDYQRGMALAGYFHEADDWADLPFQDADRLLRPALQAETIRAVIRALRQQRAVGIVYLAKKVTSHRVISPHHLVYADNRYHLRAFCHTRQQGRDFVLSRMQQAELSNVDWIPETFDLEWQQQRELRFYPNPVLPEGTLATLRHTYALGDSECFTITTRRALAKYAVRCMTRRDAELGLPLWFEAPEAI